MTETVKYIYGMSVREFSPDSHPIEGLEEIADSPTNKYQKILLYNRKLTKKEVDQYELDYITDYSYITTSQSLIKLMGSVADGIKKGLERG